MFSVLSVDSSFRVFRAFRGLFFPCLPCFPWTLLSVSSVLSVDSSFRVFRVFRVFRGLFLVFYRLNLDDFGVWVKGEDSFFGALASPAPKGLDGL